MSKQVSEWQVYRTRFLVRARQLTETLSFVDALGREHKGEKGDYLVESSDGIRRIAPRHIFEDIYVAMSPATIGPPLGSDSSTPQSLSEDSRRRPPSTRAAFV